MIKTFKKLMDMPYSLAAAAAVMTMTSEANAAEGNIGSAAGGLLTQAENVGKLMLAGAGIGGIVMFATGFFKLKQAAENPQTKYSEGAWRIAVGAGLVAIPAVAAMMGTSFGWDVPEGKLTALGGKSF